MPHIHTEPGQHDLTVSMFIVRTDSNEPRVMIHKHKKMGVWLQFGGHVELNENPWQALEHELIEETGYEIDQLELLEIARPPQAENSVSHPLPFSLNTHAIGSDHFHIDIRYAFKTSQTPRRKVGKSESQEIILITRQELLDLSDSDIWPDTRNQFLYILDNLL